MAFYGRTPTKEEKAWLDAIGEIGCIVCKVHHDTFTPASPHHIGGKTKPGAHLNTIPLCGLHHQGGNDCAEYTSRHPYKARFEARYGTEAELIEITRGMIEQPLWLR